MSVVVCFGEVMLRLTPPGYTRYSQTQSFDVAFGGAENNVAVSTACFGDQSRMITKLKRARHFVPPVTPTTASIRP